MTNKPFDSVSYGCRVTLLCSTMVSPVICSICREYLPSFTAGSNHPSSLSRICRCWSPNCISLHTVYISPLISLLPGLKNTIKSCMTQILWYMLELPATSRMSVVLFGLGLQFLCGLAFPLDLVCYFNNCLVWMYLCSLGLASCLLTFSLHAGTRLES